MSFNAIQCHLKNSSPVLGEVAEGRRGLNVILPTKREAVQQLRWTASLINIFT